MDQALLDFVIALVIAILLGWIYLWIGYKPKK